MENTELASNRQAYANYEITDTMEAGIELKGSEIKSLRNHGGSLKEAYINIKKGEVLLVNCNIAPYKYGTSFNHEEKRDKKLLLHKHEILRLKKYIQEKGFSIIPISFYLKKGFVKLKIGIGKGKKLYDKRSSIKEKEHKRSIERALKGS